MSPDTPANNLNTKELSPKYQTTQSKGKPVWFSDGYEKGFRASAHRVLLSLFGNNSTQLKEVASLIKRSPLSEQEKALLSYHPGELDIFAENISRVLTVDHLKAYQEGFLEGFVEGYSEALAKASPDQSEAEIAAAVEAGMASAMTDSIINVLHGHFGRDAELLREQISSTTDRHILFILLEAAIKCPDLTGFRAESAKYLS